MSEQEFKGRNPKSKAGESIEFFPADYWFEVLGCIRSILDPEFPAYPKLSKDGAELVAFALRRAVEMGLAHTIFELRANEFDEPMGPDFADDMVVWAKRYVDFLENCGGCEPI